MRSILALLGALVVLAGCGTARPDVAATVDGEDIAISEVQTVVTSQVIAAGMAGDRASPDIYPEVGELQRDVLGQIIQDRIVAGAADELGIEVSEADVEEQLEALAAQFGGMEPLRDELDARGMTEEDLRGQIVAFVRREHLADHFAQTAEISEEEVRELYEQRREEQYLTARSAHILVESEAEAQEILEALEDDEDFGELAEERSIDEFSAASSGDLGENPRGQFVEPFDDAVWNAEEGEVVGPVETEFGFHIIRVDGFSEQTLAQVEDEIREELRGRAAGEAFQAWMQEVGSEARVEVNPRIGRWDPETGAVVPRDPIARRAPFGTDVVGEDDAPELAPVDD